jgi:hypothetical protein
MIKFGVNTVQEAMKLGKEAALEITKCFKAPIKLEFEKVILSALHNHPIFSLNNILPNFLFPL